MDAEDLAWVEGFKWTPELRDEYADRARTLAERFAGAPDRPREPVEDGACDDCGHDGRREAAGRASVCPSCALRRFSAGIKLASETVRAERPERLVLPEPVPETWEAEHTVRIAVG